MSQPVVATPSRSTSTSTSTSTSHSNHPNQIPNQNLSKRKKHYQQNNPTTQQQEQQQHGAGGQNNNRSAPVNAEPSSTSQQHKPTKKHHHAKKHAEYAPIDPSTYLHSVTLEHTFLTLPSPNTGIVYNSSTSLFTLDGSLFEGGGQVLRNCICYAALLKKNIEIDKIRAGRDGPGGVRAQHLCGLQLVHQITGGSLEQAFVGSKNIIYKPDNATFTTNPLVYEADTRTAGATGLLLQVSLPVLLFLPHPVILTLKGGTNAIKAPTIDYSCDLFTPFMNRYFKTNIETICLKRGFYPRGGGIVQVKTEPIKGTLPSIQVLQRGKIIKFTGLALVSGRLPTHIAERMEKAAKDTLAASEYRDIPVSITVRAASREESPFDGTFFILYAHSELDHIFGMSEIGEIGKPAEMLGITAAANLIANLRTGGAVDEYLQDQLVIYMALASGTSRLVTGPLTLHTLTALHWAQALCGATVKISPWTGKLESSTRTISTGKEEEKTTSSATPSVVSSTSSSSSGQSFLIEVTGIGYQSRFHT